MIFLCISLIEAVKTLIKELSHLNNIERSFCGCLKKQHIILLCESASFIITNLSLMVQINLIPNKNYLYCLRGLSFTLFIPCINIIERLFFCDIINEKCTNTILIIRSCNRSKCLLTSLNYI